MKTFRFGEDVWVIGYKTEILDAHGRTPQENYLCDTFLSDQRMSQRQDGELSGIYSDAFTPEVRGPEGFGILLVRDQTQHWMPMFNNRSEDSVRVQMKVLVTVIRDKDLKKPLKRLYAGLRSVQVPHLYFVPPGKDERQVTFELPFIGKIHSLGTHIHPFGDSVDNATRHESVWKGTRKKHQTDQWTSIRTRPVTQSSPAKPTASHRSTRIQPKTRSTQWRECSCCTPGSEVCTTLFGPRLRLGNRLIYN